MSSLMMIMIKKFVPCKWRKTTLSLCISLLLMMKPLLLFFLKTIKKLRYLTRLFFVVFLPKRSLSQQVTHYQIYLVTSLLSHFVWLEKKCYFNGYLEMRFHHLQSQVKTLCKQNHLLAFFLILKVLFMLLFRSRELLSFSFFFAIQLLFSVTANSMPLVFHRQLFPCNKRMSTKDSKEKERLLITMTVFKS